MGSTTTLVLVVVGLCLIGAQGAAPGWQHRSPESEAGGAVAARLTRALSQPRSHSEEISRAESQAAHTILARPAEPTPTQRAEHAMASEEAQEEARMKQLAELEQAHNAILARERTRRAWLNNFETELNVQALERSRDTLMQHVRNAIEELAQEEAQAEQGDSSSSSSSAAGSPGPAGESSSSSSSDGSLPPMGGDSSSSSSSADGGPPVGGDSSSSSSESTPPVGGGESSSSSSEITPGGSESSSSSSGTPPVGGGDSSSSTTEPPLGGGDSSSSSSNGGSPPADASSSTTATPGPDSSSTGEPTGNDNSTSSTAKFVPAILDHDPFAGGEEFQSDGLPDQPDWPSPFENQADPVDVLLTSQPTGGYYTPEIRPPEPDTGSATASSTAKVWTPVQTTALASSASFSPETPVNWRWKQKMRNRREATLTPAGDDNRDVFKGLSLLETESKTEAEDQQHLKQTVQLFDEEFSPSRLTKERQDLIDLVSKMDMTQPAWLKQS